MFSALIRPTLFAVFNLALVATLSMKLPPLVSEPGHGAAAAATPVVVQAHIGR